MTTGDPSGPGGIRTRDRPLKRRQLYLTELRALLDAPLARLAPRALFGFRIVYMTASLLDCLLA